jgi:aminomethyltransferase
VSDDLQDTPLLEEHRARGAKLAPFAGWRLPVQFEGTLAEHDAVRSEVGAFDVSHLGTVWIVGPDAAAVVADSFTNDPWRLEDGASQYTLCCTDEGGIVDDLIVARLAVDRFLAVPNAANRDAVLSVLERAADGRSAEVGDETVDWAVIAVQGPRALDLAGALDLEVSGLDFTQVAMQSRHGEQLLVSRTGYTGEPGVELFVPAASAGRLWDEVLDAGATPCGLGARDTLRLEMGYPLHGNDLDTDVSPFEARLGWTVRLEREGRPPGAAALAAARERGPERRLWGLRGTGRRAPRTGMRVLDDGAEVGVVTSGSFSPTLGVGIGMALVATTIEPGHRVVVDVRGREEAFEVVRPPFVDRDPRG